MKTTILMLTVACPAVSAFSQTSVREFSSEIEPQPVTAVLAYSPGKTTFGEEASATEEQRVQQAATNRDAGEAGRPRRSAALEEVIVTAQRREERLRDVPISIAVMGAEELEGRQINDIDDLRYSVPGFSINEQGLFTRRVFLRGISNSAGSGSAVIGVSLDEADVTTDSTSQLALNAHDLERVEVLRGPQGTLYGQGSLGGTIRFIAKDPVMNEFETNVDVAALFTEGGASGQQFKGILNAPLVDDKLALRIAAMYEDEGGWIDQPAANRNDINGQIVKDVRTKILWKPVPDLTVSALMEVHRASLSGTYGEDLQGDFRQAFELSNSPKMKDDFEIYNLTLTKDFSSIRLLSATSYVETSQNATNVGFYAQLTAPGFPCCDFLIENAGDRSIFVQEIRLSSLVAGPWQWTFGGYFRDWRSGGNDALNITYVGLPGPLPPQPAVAILGGRGVSESWAGFGDVSYQLTEKLRLGAGLRYFEDRQETTADSVTQAGTFHSTAPRVYVQYKLNESVNLYGSVAKGFRSGGFNLLNQPSFGPEEVWTYELGTKMAVLSGRLSADVSVFYSDYENYQTSGPTAESPINITRNSGTVRIEGIEWDFAWQPADQWTFGLNGNYLSEYNFTELDVIEAANIVGDKVDYVPAYVVNASAERAFAWNEKQGYVRLDYGRQGPMSRNFRNIGPWFRAESETIDLLNFHTAIDLNSSLWIGVFATNLLNERGLTSPYNINTQTNEQIRARPRTYGIEFGVGFD